MSSLMKKAIKAIACREDVSSVGPTRLAAVGKGHGSSVHPKFLFPKSSDVYILTSSDEDNLVSVHI